MGLEVNGSDVEELVEEHGQELTTEELLQLHEQQRKKVVGEEAREQKPSSAIEKMLKSWESVSAYVEKYIHDKAVDVRSKNLFNQNVISHFRDILKRRQKQIFMNRFAVMRKFEPKVRESDPGVQPEVVELATEPELEIESVKPSTSHGDKELKKKVLEVAQLRQ